MFLSQPYEFYLLFKPDENPEWPTPETWLNIGLITLTFIAYAYLLIPLGFILATTLEMFALSLIFRGPWFKSLVAAFLFSLFLFGVFDYALALNLPSGQIFKAVTG